MINFPDNEIIPKDNKEQKISALIYGAPMVGKTKFASTFPNPLFLNTDGNTQDINRGIIDLRESQMIDGINTPLEKWKLFKAYVHYFKQPETIKELKDKGYETIVIDVIDHLYEWCREYVLEALGITDETEDARPFSPVYNDIKKEFKSEMVSLIEAIKSTFNLILVSFESNEEYNEGLDKKLKRTPSLKKLLENSTGKDKRQIYQAITSRLGMVGAIVMAHQKTEDGGLEELRVLLTTSSKDCIAGNRLGIEKPIIPPHYDALKKHEHEGEQNV